MSTSERDALFELAMALDCLVPVNATTDELISALMSHGSSNDDELIINGGDGVVATTSSFVSTLTGYLTQHEMFSRFIAGSFMSAATLGQGGDAISNTTISFLTMEHTFEQISSAISAVVTLIDNAPVAANAFKQIVSIDMATKSLKTSLDWGREGQIHVRHDVNNYAIRHLQNQVACIYSELKSNLDPVLFKTVQQKLTEARNSIQTAAIRWLCSILPYGTALMPVLDAILKYIQKQGNGVNLAVRKLFDTIRDKTHDKNACQYIFNKDMMKTRIQGIVIQTNKEVDKLFDNPAHVKTVVLKAVKGMASISGSGVQIPLLSSNIEFFLKVAKLFIPNSLIINKARDTFEGVIHAMGIKDVNELREKVNVILRDNIGSNIERFADFMHTLVVVFFAFLFLIDCMTSAGATGNMQLCLTNSQLEQDVKKSCVIM